jgi:transcriptional regulator with XRE-family HTH domain
MRAFSAREGKAKTSDYGNLELHSRIRGVAALLCKRKQTNMDGMPGSSTRGTRNRRTERERTGLWKRVGAFVSKRREELGLSQGDIIRVLGYKSRNAVSNIEVGIEGLPAKRAYAWADVLELPRDAFFRFVTGEADRVDVPKAATKPEGGDRLTAAEGGLIATYRKLPPKYQRRLREQAEEYSTLARATRRTTKG